MRSAAGMEAGGARAVRARPGVATGEPAAYRRGSPRATAARGVRRTYYIPPDIAARFDQVVEDLAYDLRLPKLDILGVLLARAIEDVSAVRAQFQSLATFRPD